jgi:HlyD family secretion protein
MIAAAAAALLLLRLLRPSPVTVDVAAAETGPMMVTVGDEGTTRVRERYLVTAPVSGRVQRIRLLPGDTVREGSVVALLTPMPLDPRGRRQAEAAVSAAGDQKRVAQAAMEQVRIALAEATRERERAERLVAGGGLAPVELDRLRFAEQSRQRELEAARFRAQGAAHEEEVARAALVAADPAADGTARLSLRSPVSGRVLAVPEQSARVVAPGTVLLELGDPTALEVVVDLLSTDAVRIPPGARMLLVGWGGDSALTGRVRRIEPSAFTRVSALGVEEQRVNVIGDFFCDSTGRLGDRYRVEVRVVLWENDRVLRIPPSALFREGDRWAVFVVEDGVARHRVVSVGHESETSSEILGGLADGDVVIRHPTERIAEGVRVRPRQ